MLFFVLCCAPFPFGVLSRMLYSIVSVSDLCLSMLLYPFTEFNA